MVTCEAEVVVLLTVYNRLSVKNTIESILSQTFRNFQLLIIDNASDDGTYELLTKYREKDKRIVLVRNEKNMGQTYSLHIGMTLAKGKYIARIDADDLMAPERLLKQYTFLEENPEYGLCGSWIQLITDDDRKGEIVRTCITDEGLRVMQRIGCAVYHPAVMMRKSLLDKYNLAYNEHLSMAEDYDMWRQILCYSKGVNLPEVLTYYRRGNNDSVQHQGVTFSEAHFVKKLILNQEEFFAERKIVEKITEYEFRERKSLIHTIVIFGGYRRYLRSNLSKDSLDYNAVKRRIITYTIGVCLLHNKAWWAKKCYALYQRIRANRYQKYTDTL